MSSSEVDRRNVGHSMRKSVENLVISSQDAIGQSISQALNFSGIISQEIRNVSRSPSPCRIIHETPQAESSETDKNDGILLSVPSNVSVGGDSNSTSSQNESSPQPQLKPEAPIFRNHSITPQQSKTSSQDNNRVKKKSWYSALYPTYKSRSDDFRRLFKDLPDDERLIVDYSCALQKDILAHGRLYVSQNYLCFYANIFGWETSLVLKLKDITSITKEKTALVIPNAILVSTVSEKHFWTSFSGRDKAYLMLFRVWQNALMGQQMSSQELWQWVHSCYGEELGFNSDDEEYPKDLLDEDKLAAAVRFSADSITEDVMESGVSWSSPEGMASDEVVNLMEGPFRENIELPPTDLSDTTESDGEHSNNGGSSKQCQERHEGRKLLDMELAIDIDQLFTMLFTNSKFCLELLASRKSSDYVQSAWKTNNENGLKCRQVTYTLALSQAVGPKCAYVTETQVMNNCSKPGTSYSIDISSVNAGVPYADSFYVLVHYCLRRTARAHTCLTIIADIKYKKNVWAFIKGFIEKNTWAGLEEYCMLLKELLIRECEGDPQTKRKGRRRRRAMSTCHESTERSGSLMLTNGGPQFGRKKSESNIWLYGIVILLLLINFALCYKLYDIRMRSHREDVLMDDSFSDAGEMALRWREALDSQARGHRGALRSWGKALKTAVDALQQTEKTISELIEEIKPTLVKAQEGSDDLPTQHQEL